MHRRTLLKQCLALHCLKKTNNNLSRPFSCLVQCRRHSSVDNSRPKQQMRGGINLFIVDAQNLNVSGIGNRESGCTTPHPGATAKLCSNRRSPSSCRLIRWFCTKKAFLCFFLEHGGGEFRDCSADMTLQQHQGTNNANAASKHTTCAASSTAALHTLFLRTAWVRDVIPAPLLTLF